MRTGCVLGFRVYIQCTFSLILRVRSRCQARSSAILARLYALARSVYSACCSDDSGASSVFSGVSTCAATGQD